MGWEPAMTPLLSGIDMEMPKSKVCIRNPTILLETARLQAAVSPPSASQVGVLSAALPEKESAGCIFKGIFLVFLWDMHLVVPIMR